MIQSAKMASLGNLVAGIVHEMNSPIGSLKSCADVNGRCINIILEELRSHDMFDEFARNRRFMQAVDTLQRNIGSNLSASARLAMIVGNLKSFVHLGEPSFEETDLHPGLENTLALLEPRLKDRIAVKTEFEEIPKVTCCAAELNQVFMNILLNAAEAIHNQGSITVKTFVDNGNVCVQIADTGVGIPPEHMKRLFEPTFSQKEDRIKAGMGLFTALNIVEKHKGQIKVDSDVGKGTTFSIILPGAARK